MLVITRKEKLLWTMLIVAAFLLMLALSLARVAHAQEEIIYNTYDTLEALDGASWTIECIVYHETDPKWDPYSVGAAGELGIAQLHPRGELQNFLYGDWTVLPSERRNPFSPYQSVAYLEWYGMTYGHYGPWTTWWSYCR